MTSNLALEASISGCKAHLGAHALRLKAENTIIMTMIIIIRITSFSTNEASFCYGWRVGGRVNECV